MLLRIGSLSLLKSHVEEHHALRRLMNAKYRAPEALCTTGTASCLAVFESIPIYTESKSMNESIWAGHIDPAQVRDISRNFSQLARHRTCPIPYMYM